METVSGQPVQNQPQQAQPVQAQPQPAQPTQPVIQKTGINKLFIVIAVVIIVAVAAGGVFAYQFYKNSQANKNAITANGGSIPKPSSSPAQTQEAVVNNTANDTSDAQIDKDLQSIDNSLSSLDANGTAVDQGFNDQPVNLQ